MTHDKQAKSRPEPTQEPRKQNRLLSQKPDSPQWRRSMYEVIFEADTFWGRTFDIGLLIAILASVTIIAIETLPTIRDSSLGTGFLIAEKILALLFGLEYACRVISSRRPLRYIFSFWGIIDLLCFLPSILSGFSLQIGPGSRESSFTILRSIRLLRVFRILKLWRMISEANDLADAVWQSRDKIIVFLSVVLIAVTISGTLMYHVENYGLDSTEESKFSSIPQSMYWAIVTMTTVGYGDIVPATTAGKFISSALILLGYSLIIVPTGFVSAEITGKLAAPQTEKNLMCPQCEKRGHERGAHYCSRCGHILPEDSVFD